MAYRSRPLPMPPEGASEIALTAVAGLVACVAKLHRIEKDERTCASSHGSLSVSARASQSILFWSIQRKRGRDVFIVQGLIIIRHLPEISVEHVIMRRPIRPLDSTKPEEPIMDRARRINNWWRETTFISCWSSAEHESYALWAPFLWTE
jgi:hypothetical protein